MKRLNLYTVAILMCVSHSTATLALDGPMSTYQRQVNLMKRINEAQKTKALTVRQAKNLRKDLSKVAVKKQKIRDDHDGKKGTEDMSNVEERLTEISDRINELKQENLREAAEKLDKDKDKEKLKQSRD